MNKMVKGTLAIGVGAALLLGGGGTLAVWNAEKNASMGTVAAGNLNLETEPGYWANKESRIGNIADYKIVPGESLIYTQKVNVVLDGTNIKANLTATDTSNPNGPLSSTSPFNPADITVSAVQLEKEGKTVTGPLTTTVNGITAKVTFTFKADTKGRGSAGAKYDFSNVAFKLDQVAP